MPSLVFGAGVTVSGRCAGALSIAGGNGVGNGIGKITDAGPWKKSSLRPHENIFASHSPVSRQ
eukprot:scaffold13359_cov258-Alexandrium_tamarense.AAC.3